MEPIENKLELKYLAAYSPYQIGIEVSWFSEDNSLSLIYSDGVNCTFRSKQLDGVMHTSVKCVKLKLRPLSCLMKEIEHNDVRFVPGIALSTTDNLMTGHTWNYYAINNDNVMLLNYEIIEKLFEWHFDVFGLIEKGLAVPIT